METLALALELARRRHRIRRKRPPERNSPMATTLELDQMHKLQRRESNSSCSLCSRSVFWSLHLVCSHVRWLSLVNKRVPVSATDSWNEFSFGAHHVAGFGLFWFLKLRCRAGGSGLVAGPALFTTVTSSF